MSVPWGAVLWSGFIAIVLSVALLRVLSAVGWIAYTPTVLVGCLFTGDARRPVTDTIGLVVLLVLGSTVVSALYTLMLTILGGPDWVVGAVLGFVHGFLLAAALPVYGTVSACVRRGGVTRPGRWGFGWGRLAPAALLTAHVFYGAVLGAMLRAF